MALRSSATSRTTIARRLNRRTRHGAIRTKHATIALLGFQFRAALLAVVEEQARIGWHGLRGCEATRGTSNGGLQLDHERLTLRPGRKSRDTGGFGDRLTCRFGVVEHDGRRFLVEFDLHVLDPVDALHGGFDGQRASHARHVFDRESDCSFGG